jgi:hypothetical protein
METLKGVVIHELGGCSVTIPVSRAPVAVGRVMRLWCAHHGAFEDTLGSISRGSRESYSAKRILLFLQVSEPLMSGPTDWRTIELT